MPHKSPSRVCLLHDMFLYRGWAERFNIMMAKCLNADLAALFFDPESFHIPQMGFQGKLIAFGKNTRSRFMRQVLLKWRLLFKTGFLKQYSTVIFSNDTLSAIRNVAPGTKKIFYAHSLPRYLFDQRELYYRKVPVLFRPIYLIARSVYTRMFLSEIALVDTIYTNSTNLQQAIKKHLGYDSTVIHPPVDTSVFVPTLDKGDYYISFSKLSSAKRVKETVEAFMGIPEKKLLVIYGENDPQKSEIQDMAKESSNIQFLHLENNEELPLYIGRAIATVFIAKNEDFWMVALESMATGVPVIGVDEWGIRETVIDGKTGILIDPDFSLEDLRNAIRLMTPEYAHSLRDDCRKRSEEFNHVRFSERLRQEFDS